VVAVALMASFFVNPMSAAADDSLDLGLASVEVTDHSLQSGDRVTISWSFDGLESRDWRRMTITFASETNPAKWELEIQQMDSQGSRPFNVEVPPGIWYAEQIEVGDEASGQDIYSLLVGAETEPKLMLLPVWFALDVPDPQAPTPPASMDVIAGPGNFEMAIACENGSGFGLPVFYTVTAVPTSGPGVVVTRTHFDDCPQVLTELVAGTTHSVTATATTAVGTSDPSATDSATAFGVPPTTPAELVATVGDGEAELAWDASDGLGKRVKAYLIEWYDADGLVGETGIADWNGPAAADTSVTIDELQNGVEYTFRVQAMTDLGFSEWSGFSEPFIPDGPLPPSTPTDLLAARVAADVIDVSWTPGVADDGAPILDHQIRVEVPGSEPSTMDVSDASAQLDNVWALSVHSISVRSRNVAGWSPWSESVEVGPWPNFQLPSAVPGLSVVGGLTRADVSWLPATAGDLDLWNYRVYVTAGRQAVLDPTTSGGIFTLDPTYEVPDVQPSTDYTVTVFARDEQGNYGPGQSILLRGTAVTSLAINPVTKRLVRWNAKVTKSFDGKPIAGLMVVLQRRDDTDGGRFRTTERNALTGARGRVQVEFRPHAGFSYRLAFVDHVGFSGSASTSVSFP